MPPAPLEHGQRAGYTGIMDVPNELLRAARVALNIGQRELAKLSGVGQRTILRIERNDETVTLESRRRLQEAFEKEGITFIPADGTSGPGLRVRRDLVHVGRLRF
jgi:transcriptional regulator with XRE-family HTH domain